jgi:hypothetical protein
VKAPLQPPYAAMQEPFGHGDVARTRAELAQEMWLFPREAWRYVGNVSIEGFYEWVRRKRQQGCALVTDGRGRYLRRELDAAIAIPRKTYTRRRPRLADVPPVTYSEGQR